MLALGVVNIQTLRSQPSIPQNRRDWFETPDPEYPRIRVQPLHRFGSRSVWVWTSHSDLVPQEKRNPTTLVSSEPGTIKWNKLFWVTVLYSLITVAYQPDYLITYLSDHRTYLIRWPPT